MQLSAPLVRVGDPQFPSNPARTPRAFDGFAIFDGDGDGVVNGAAGNGTFPFFPGNVGNQTAAQAGSRYASRPGVPRANLVLGYLLDRGEGQGAPGFVVLHLFIDPNNVRNITPVSVFYGDARAGVAGDRVWSGDGAVVNLTLTPGDVARDQPNILEGRVTATVSAPDFTARVIDFPLRLAVNTRG